MKILLVDDQPRFCQMMNEWLTSQGHQVVELWKGSEVLDVLGDGSYDLVLLDVMMPDVNGMTLISRIRKEPHTAVIVVSAIMDTSVAVLAAIEGAEACFDKPVDFNALRAQLVRLEQAINSNPAPRTLTLRCEPQERQLPAKSSQHCN